MHRATLRVWDEAACRRVHEASLEILTTTGVDMKHERARDLCAAAGAAIDGRRVRLPAALVEQALASAPRAWTLYPRAGETAPLELTQGPTYFGSGPDCLYVSDLETGRRRRGTLADVTRGAAVAEALPNIDFVMSMALPEDAPSEAVDVAQFAAMLKGTRKPIVVSSPFGGASLHTMRRMAELAGEARSLACLAMTSPPLMLDDVCCDKALACAELEIPLILATSVSAGAQGPASISACVVVSNAEILATLVLHQLARPGAPFLFGVGTGGMNMRTMVDVYGAPAAFLGDQAHLDLVARYGLPTWSYAGFSDSKLLDEQWALEMGLSTALGALCRATLLHDVGYLESGMQSALEGLVLGDEVIGFLRVVMGELPVDDEALALDEVVAAGPGGSHLGTKMTRRLHRGFWAPRLIDQNNHERWVARGGSTLLERTRARAREILAAPPAFALEPDVVVALDGLASARPPAS